MKIFAFLACLCVSSWSFAAEITLKSGGTLKEVEIIRQTEPSDGFYEIYFRKGHSIFMLPSNVVDSIASVPLEEKPRKIDRLPPASMAIDAAVEGKWGGELRQIPAIVIEKGIFSNIPYTSYRSGDYEINVYGDPERPAGIEIGCYNTAPGPLSLAKTRCIAYIEFLIQKDTVNKLIQSMNQDRDKHELDGLTFEISPPSEEDSYGAWWISVYSVPMLEKARATAEEMKVLANKPRPPTTRPAVVHPQTVIIENNINNWTPNDAQYVRRWCPRIIAPRVYYPRSYTHTGGSYSHAPAHFGGGGHHR